MSTETQEFHWFTSSALHWTVDNSLTRCLNSQRRADTPKDSGFRTKGCDIYRVPVPIKSHYKIRDYAPQVKGAEFIASERY